ncbi:unnamed protein product [Blepharisma stoltei]|uniref:Phosphoglycerate mutase n=1 Tax=Blepharisma stoltei TaxID=1481888 RepID=A0AAU9JRF6_9CILI|nr:unnamed protein product [Blepharisma stoltei]
MERKRIFLIRHAQSRVNQLVEEHSRLGKIADLPSLEFSPESIDTELSPHGESQAIQVIASARALHIKIVLVSPLRRALKTAKILFENHPDRPRIIVHPSLTENLHHGADVSSYQGLPYQDYLNFDWSLISSDYYLLNVIQNEFTERLKSFPIQNVPVELLNTMRNMQPNWIETDESIYRRAQDTKEIWKKYLEEGNIALVGHSNFMKFFTMSRDKRSFKWLENCEIYEYEGLL